ncbi:MAG TPA: hypothetical protein VGB55_09110 [Tepidisphaeraceae bacterium]
MKRPTPPAPNDVLCEACGYTLNGLSESGNCPECGTPVAFSTTESPRRPPAWEQSGIRSGVARFSRTAAAVLLHPSSFGQTISVHQDVRRSKSLAWICLIVTAYLNTKTIIVHEALTGVLTLGGPMVVIGGFVLLPIVSLAFWWGMVHLVAWLTALESKFWGYRMPRFRVLRVLNYLTLHLIAASMLPLLATTAFAVFLAFDQDNGQFAVQYLYGLSAVIVIAALYLFVVYWRAMKAILNANDEVAFVGATPASSVSVDRPSTDDAGVAPTEGHASTRPVHSSIAAVRHE